jgi:hypothetical protein
VTLGDRAGSTQETELECWSAELGRRWEERLGVVLAQHTHSGTSWVLHWELSRLPVWAELGAELGLLLGEHSVTSWETHWDYLGSGRSGSRSGKWDQHSVGTRAALGQC